jgi:hypothetical protein
VTDIQDAEDIGRQYLQFRNATLSGTVTTFGLYDAEPGDTINITIESRGIDTEFRIAAVEYRWGRDETILTVVERRGDQDKILSRISESVKRQEMETADRDAPSNRITTTEANAIIDVSVDADGNTPDGTRFVNPGRNAVRDAWATGTALNITTLLVGDDGTGLSRSNTSINNQTKSASVTQSLPNTKTVKFDASITETGVKEIGLELDGGTLLSRAVFDTAVDIDGVVTVTLTVSNDNTVNRGVLTNDGQTAVRDILANNNPNTPTGYAYGSDGTAVSESNTSLGNELYTASLTSVLVQLANNEQSWTTLIESLTNNPVDIVNGELKLLQSAFVGEAEANAQDTVLDSSYSDGEAAEIIEGVGSGFDFTFTNEYDIPQSNAAIYFRGDRATQGTVNAVDIRLDNQIIGFGSRIPIPNTTTPVWSRVNIDTDIPAGTHSVNVEYSGFAGNTEPRFDLIAVVDERYVKDVSNLDNTLSSSGGYLDDPLLYPTSYAQTLSTVNLRRPTTEGSFDSIWNDTSGNQFIEITGGVLNIQTFNNTQNGSFTLSSSSKEIDVTLGLSTYPLNSNARSTTPRFGYNGQKVNIWSLNINPPTPSPDDIGTTNARAIVPPNTSGITGNTVREAGLKSGSTLLTHHQLAEFVLETDQRLASSETNRFKGTE